MVFQRWNQKPSGYICYVALVNSTDWWLGGYLGEQGREVCTVDVLAARIDLRAPSHGGCDIAQTATCCLHAAHQQTPLGLAAAYVGYSITCLGTACSAAVRRLSAFLPLTLSRRAELSCSGSDLG